MDMNRYFDLQMIWCDEYTDVKNTDLNRQEKKNVYWTIRYFNLLLILNTKNNVCLQMAVTFFSTQSLFSNTFFLTVFRFNNNYKCAFAIRFVDYTCFFFLFCKLNERATRKCLLIKFTFFHNQKLNLFCSHKLNWVCNICLYSSMFLYRPVSNNRTILYTQK